MSILTWADEATRLEREWGIVMDGAQAFVPAEYKRDFALAMDAQPTLVTTSSAGVPAFLTQLVDPNIIRVLQAPNKGADILGEEKRGTWLDETALFPMVENTGEVSSYGDFNANGRAGLNTNWENRQSYLYQVIIEYGERELERAGLARINWANELQNSAVLTLNKFQDYTYHFGVAGLELYGILNDPSLSAALTPSTKAAGGAKWVTNGAVTATANEVYGDIQALFSELVAQTGGYVDAEARLTVVMSPGAMVGLTATNMYGVSVMDLLKKSYPNVRFVSDPRYATTAGNVVQMILDSLEGQDTGFCAFNEKLRTHPVIRAESSFRQKYTQGTWGAVIRVPAAIAQMVGV